jgi:stage II sporulation protein D
VPLPMEPAQSFRIGGSLQIMARDGAMLVINEIGMEEYVKGVVPSEMSAGWHPEALKVQAVATRTYALYQRLANAGREFDVVATTQDQVYRGRQGVDERVQQAVEATRSIVITYQDAPILAAFSSTAAGPTEDAMNVWSKDLPYLKGVECPFDENSPYYQWRVELPVLSLEQSLRKQGIPVGTIATVTPFLYSRAGRVDKIRILHSDGEVILRGQDFRKAIGYSIIPSTQFEIEALGRMVVFAGRGSGHAVGLCQWGAKELADQGYSYDAILRYYFPGTALQQTASLHLSSR